MPPFDDEELQRYYQRIEARTDSSPVRGNRRTRSAQDAQDPPPACPTPAKSGYHTADDAWLAVSVLRAGRLRTPELDVYRCRCGLWHFTTRQPG